MHTHPASTQPSAPFPGPGQLPVGDSVAGSTQLSSLTHSLLMDLQRFGNEPGREGSLDVLAVLAAVVRHGRSLLVTLRVDGQTLPITIFPTARIVHSAVPMADLLAGSMAEWRVLQVEPARLEPPTAAELGHRTHSYTPLPLLLWAVALRGSREALLPEIAGTAAYRVTPSADLGALELTGSLATAVTRLRRRTTNLRDIARWPGLDAPRAHRLLNGLYLQAALLVSRTHPAATNEGWTEDA